MHERQRLTPYLFGLLLTLGAAPLVAQTTNATMTGIVTDASGGVVANATVTATNTASGVTRNAATNEAGLYTLASLLPGTYDLKVTMQGFKTKIQTGVVLETGAVVKADVTLEVGSVTESVEVTAAAPMMQTQETSVAGVVTQQQLERIPVNGRNYTRLLVLMPGTSDIQRSQGRGGLSGAQMVSINGQRTQDNNYTLDGVDNNMMFMNSPGDRRQWTRSRSFAWRRATPRSLAARRERTSTSPSSRAHAICMGAFTST